MSNMKIIKTAFDHLINKLIKNYKAILSGTLIGFLTGFLLSLIDTNWWDALIKLITVFVGAYAAYTLSLKAQNKKDAKEKEEKENDKQKVKREEEQKKQEEIDYKNKLIIDKINYLIFQRKHIVSKLNKYYNDKNNSVLLKPPMVDLHLNEDINVTELLPILDKKIKYVHFINLLNELNFNYQILGSHIKNHESFYFNKCIPHMEEYNRANNKDINPLNMLGNVYASYLEIIVDNIKEGIKDNLICWNKGEGEDLDLYIIFSGIIKEIYPDHILHDFNIKNKT